MGSMINIKSTQAAIGIETQKAQIRSRPAQLMLRMRQIPARMQIESRQTRIKIDQTQAFSESGLKTSLELARVFYQNSFRVGLEAIGTIAAESRRFLQIERGGNAIAELARNRGIRQGQLNVVCMPKSGPNISWEPGYININWEAARIEADWEYTEPDFEYIPHSVRIYMRALHKIEITVDEIADSNFVPPKLGSGRNVDQTL